MKHELAKEVVACLPKGRTLFHYSKDDYAFLLLHHFCRRETRIHKLKSTAAGKLLQKPALKPHLAHCCDGEIDPALIPRRQHLPDGQAFRLSLDIWGDDVRYWRMNQVSRKGVSLVLQLNLNKTYRQKLKRCVDLEDYDPFAGWGHPVRDGEFPTLGWCRIDFDLDSRTALIEEIQTDLLREMKSVVKTAYEEREKKTKRFDKWGAEFETNRLIDFWEQEFSRYEKIWHEAMLTAALSFLIEEIGITTIYYHTHESGRFLKGISGYLPPRSLYTKLPKQFCFELGEEAPDFLVQSRNWKRKLRAAKHPLEFFKMAI